MANVQTSEAAVTVVGPPVAVYFLEHVQIRSFILAITEQHAARELLVADPWFSR
jgi:hypothetical protein